MLESISPYALLSASKPKPPRSFTTPYDQFSLVHRPSSEESTAYAALPADLNPQNRPMSPQLSRKTHYIADIQARHTQAIRRSKPFVFPS